MTWQVKGVLRFYPDRWELLYSTGEKLYLYIHYFDQNTLLEESDGFPVWNSSNFEGDDVSQPLRIISWTGSVDGSRPPEFERPNAYGTRPISAVTSVSGTIGPNDIHIDFTGSETTTVTGTLDEPFEWKGEDTFQAEGKGTWKHGIGNKDRASLIFFGQYDVGEEMQYRDLMRMEGLSNWNRCEANLDMIRRGLKEQEDRDTPSKNLEFALRLVDEMEVKKEDWPGWAVRRFGSGEVAGDDEDE